jgi:hypothetical protein
MKNEWSPEWYVTGRMPAFLSEISPLPTLDTTKYSWSNLPALDILELKKNEGIENLHRDLHLLFAASGDLRNVVKTVVGIPDQYKGNCTVVLNDLEFAIVARNAIMLLIAFHFDADTAVPLIIHLWYSALLPATMVQALRSEILPRVTEVCDKIEHKPVSSLHAESFLGSGQKLRLVLKKEEWTQLAQYFQVPSGLSVEDAGNIRRRVVLAPERIDYREYAMLPLSPVLRQVDSQFREKGVMLPYGSSTSAFDTPNP